MAKITKISVSVSLFVILLSWELIDAQSTQSKENRGLEKFKRFHPSQDHLVLENNTLENFNRALHLVTNNSEFQPLLLSIGSFGFCGKILYRITEYLTEHSVDYYQFDLEVFANRDPNLQSGLTWIIVIDNYSTLDSYVRENMDFWRATNKFLILFIGKETIESLNNWLNIFNFLWNRHKVCKVLIASYHENFRYLYRYMPFDKMGEEFGTVQRLNVEDVSNNKEVGSTTKGEQLVGKIKFKEGSPMIFEDFENLNGYPVHVTVFASLMMNVTTNKDNETSYTMLDGNVMNLVEERLGSKFRIKVIGSREDGDPFMNALGTIEGEGQSDIVFTAYFAKLYLSQFVFTASIFEDKVCLIGPSSEPIPKFFLPLLPFEYDLWFLLLLYNLVIAVLWFLIQRIQSKFRRRSKVITTIPIDIKIKALTYRISNERGGINQRFVRPIPLHVRSRYSMPYTEPRKIHPWIVGFFDLLTLACYPLSGGKTCTERAFLFGTLFFGVVVVGLYQSNLVSSLSKPIFYPELNTLLDVAESNRTIITKYKNLQQDTFAQGTPISDRLRKKIIISRSQEKTYDLVAHRGFVSIGRSSSFQLENLTDYYNKGTNKLMLHMVKECPATYPLSYPARMYSPYLERIDGLLLRMKQSGLIDKWYGDMLLRVKVETARNIPNKSNEHAKLTLEHLSLTFFGLIIGLFCSTIVFLAELYYTRRLR